MKTLFDRTVVPESAPIRPFVLPAPAVDSLDNGLAVYVARRPGLPIATAQIVVDAGAATEPHDRAGLACLTTRALDTGTRERPGSELAWAFERLGIELEAYPTWDAGVLRATGPRDRLEAATALLAEVVLAPAFPESEVERLRAEQLAELRQRLKEPRSLGTDLAARFIFGESATYGRTVLGSRASVERFGRDHLVTFHRARFTPGSTALVVTGDVQPDEAVRVAERYFGHWTGEPAPPAPFRAAQPAAGPRVHIVHRPDSVQSELRIGHVGVQRRHPDFFAIRVMNTLLGGAFTSRLNLNLRERHGFTYGVRSGFGFRREPGPFIIQTAVATDVTAPAVAEILREVRALHDDGATDSEVEAARDYLAGVLPLELQTTAQLAERLAELPVFGLGLDDFSGYAERVRAVTRDEVDRVARERLQPDDLVVVIVGDATAVRGPIAELDIGPVSEHEAQS